MTKIPVHTIDYLNLCNEEIFPNIYALLRILNILPITTATTERSFSTLKYLKSYLRSITGQDRLNGLALLYIYSYLHINTEDVLNILSKKSRKINISL